MSIRNSLRVRGIAGTLHLSFLRLFNFKKTPEYILSRMLDLRRYDRKHNVQTAGLIELSELNVDSPSKTHGVRYSAATPWRFKDILERIPIDHKQYTFIDVGSGKGAALLYASEYPFNNIVGVEFAPSLHAAAIRNIAAFRSKSQKCTRITSICCDATEYEYPASPWVLFFNSPFGAPIWEKVAGNIARARQSEQNSYLVFMNYGWLPEAHRFVEDLSFLKMIYRDEAAEIFDILSPADAHDSSGNAGQQ